MNIMQKIFKPEGYNSLSPYFVVDEAQRFIDLLKQIFNAKELRRYERPDGSIMHAELQIDDSVLMLGNSTKEYHSNQLLIHLYVPDVDQTFKKAVTLGCDPLQIPKIKDEDPDKRGMFKDFAGKVWAVGTQTQIGKKINFSPPIVIDRRS